MADRDPRPAAASADPLRTTIHLLVAGLFVGLLCLLVLGLAYQRQNTVAAGQSRAENLALILGDHLARAVSAVDTTLGQLALHGARIGGPKASREAWLPALEAARAVVAGVVAISVIDEAGTLLHSTIPALVGPVRADRFLLRELARGPSLGLLADTPFRGQVSGEWLVPLGRRLTTPDGTFAGTVVATLAPEQLRSFYRAVDVGRTGRVWVLHPEGQVMFREPPPAAGEEGRERSPLVGLGAQPSPAFLRAPLEPGGGVYLTAQRKLPNVPLAVAVSLAEADVLAEWWRTALISGALALAIGLLLALADRSVTRAIRARVQAEARAIAHAAAETQAVADRDQADADLRAHRAGFQTIMDHAPMMVSLKDLAGRYTFVNRAFGEYAGFSGHELIGRTVAEVLPADAAAGVARQDAAIIAGKRVAQWEMTAPGPRGPRTSLLIKFPVLDDRGELVAIGTIMADITEQKRIEAELAHAQRMESVGQLTGGIAHDFNNLLTAIMLNSDVLVSQIKDERLRPLAEAMRTAAERGSDLTRRLLAFARRQVLAPQPTDVNQLLAAMEPLMHRTLGEHIDVQIRQGRDLWLASVDPGQLENAVINLAVNARDAMPNGGQLTIETMNAELDELYAQANPDVKPGEYVMIAVADSGGGMPADVAARAFEPFFTTKETGKGTGLGLSMVYGFVKQSGGHVRIYSELGLGTVVRLYVPRSGAKVTAEDAAPPVAAELPTGGETILFVEDDPLVRAYTGNQLAALGYDVVTAEHAAAALAHVANGCKPDLLFTDMVMPGGMNGRELALELKARWPDLKVLYTSGYAHGVLTTASGEPIPPRYVLGKPYRRRDLAAKLRDVLDEPPARG